MHWAKSTDKGFAPVVISPPDKASTKFPLNPKRQKSSFHSMSGAVSGSLRASSSMKKWPNTVFTRKSMARH